MEKTFMRENLWNIFEVAREERTDGDNFVGDMGLAHDLFLNGLEPDGKQYQCMEGLDKAALLEAWEGIEDQQAEYDAYHALVDEHYKALTAAFSAGDRAGFEAVVEGAVPAPEDAGL